MSWPLSYLRSGASKTSNPENIMANDAVLSHLRLSIDPQAQVLICCHDTCRFALAPSPTQVSEHLRRKHSVTATERRQAIDILKARIGKLKDPSDAPIRQDGSSCDPNLILVHGFTCKFCIERTGSSQTISRHITLKHEVEMLRLRVQRKAMYEPAFLQAWTKSPPGGRYWIVEHAGSTIRPVGGEEAHDHLKDILERERGRQRLMKEINMADGTLMGRKKQSTSFTDLRPWLERTGWEQTFQGVDRELLRNLTAVPSLATSRQGLVLRLSKNLSAHPYAEEQMTSSADDESRIAALMFAVDAVMDRCEQTARTTSRSLLCWLRSVRPHVCYVKPFTFVGKAASRKKYIRLLKRFIAMVFRAYNLPADVRRRRARIHLKKAQIRQIAAIWNHGIWKQPDALAETLWRSIKSSAVVDLEQDSDEESINKEENSEDNASSEYGSSVLTESEGSEDDYVDDGDGEYEYYRTLERDEIHNQNGESRATGGLDGKTPPLIEEVLELLFGLIMEFSTEEVADGRPASTLLVYFSGILGFPADLNGFLPARSYTSNLAALIYVQRLLFLEYALPARGYHLLGIPTRPRTGQVPQLQVIRQEYLVLGSQSPFEELFSLLAYGRAIASSETPAFLLTWSDDGQTVSYKDEISVHMEKFRRLPMTLLERAEALCSELMYGWRPPCDLFSVKDDISNTTHGFSFVSHPKNGLTDAYLELSLKACTNQAVPLSRKGKWHRKAVLAFFKKEEAMREVLADLMLMVCGGQPRSPDLLEVRVRNYGTAERNFYIYNGFVIYVTRSHKAKRSTNREFIVARFLPFRAGQLLYMYLVYIRPFVDMLTREHQPYINECSPYLFRSRPDLDSPCWSTERLTRVVRRFTREVWGQGVTLRLLRQLCIGITDKHVREVSQPFNRFDDRTDKADRGVAFAWSSGHRPLQRARTYGLDGAFPTHLQPQLLERYEWVSVRWHEFLHIPSRCTSKLAGIDIRSRNHLLSTPDTESISNDFYDFPPESPRQSSPSVSSSSTVVFERNSKAQSSRKHHVPATSQQTPAKRRRSQFTELLSSMIDPPESIHQDSTTPIFGYRRDFESLATADEYEMIVSYLKKKQVEIQPLNKNEVEIVVSNDGDEHVSNHPFIAAPYLDLNDRLSWVHRTTEDWRFAGCELCFITKDERAPDHGLEDCAEWPASRHAKRILSWLTSLQIPRYYDTEGACSMCGHGWLVCGEMRHGEMVRKEACNQGTNNIGASLMESRDIVSNSDGFCENKPVIRRMIAALCAYDDQILGKVLTRITLDHEGIDLTSDTQAKLWLEQRIRSPDDYWMSRLVYVLDQLVMAYDFRRSKKQAPEKSSWKIDPRRPERQNDDLELRDWRSALEWLKGRCTFCAGRGLRGAQIRHTVRHCDRGGSAQLTQRLGDMFYEEGLTPSSGCKLCSLPYELCARWKKSNRGEWTLKSGGKCTYGNHLLCDSIIGFVSCGVRHYEEDLFQEVNEFSNDEEEGLPYCYDEEAAALWLSRPLKVGGVVASEMLRRLFIWTVDLVDFQWPEIDIDLVNV